jgi:hypothetical protein
VPGQGFDFLRENQAFSSKNRIEKRDKAQKT